MLSRVTTSLINLPAEAAGIAARLSGSCKVLALALALTGCGGLDSSSTSFGEDDGYAVQGNAVKGPLAHANVSAYLLDTSRPDLRGELVALGLTSASAELELSIAAEHATRGPFLLEFTGGSELSGSTPALQVLRTVLSVEQLQSGTPVFATPLTTFVIAHAQSIADLQGSAGNPLRSGLLGDNNGDITLAEFEQALATASDLAAAALGVGVLPQGLDLFTTSPMLDGSAAAQDILALRTANEVLAALVVHLHEEIAAIGPSAGTDALLSALAKDFGDGVFDGMDNEGATVAALAPLSDLAASLSQNPVQLIVPGTTTPIADIAGLLLTEASALELAGSSEQLPAQSVEPVQTSVFETEAATENPDPQPQPEPEPAPEPVNTAPTASFANPLPGASFLHDQAVTATLLVNDAESNIDHCDIRLNGAFVVRLESAPWSVDLGLLAPGDHQLGASCVDTPGLSTTAQRTFSVTAPEPTPEPEPVNLAPSVAIDAPAANAVFDFGNAVSVSVSATDSDGSIAHCDLSVNGNFVSRDSTPPYLFSGGSLGALLPGSHSLQASCQDNQGAVSSASVNISVNPPPEPPNQAPTASFAAPAAGQQFTEGDAVYVRIEPQDSDGSIAHCNVSLNGNSVRQENFAPYEWGVGGSELDNEFVNLPPGQHRLLGICVDDDNASVSIETSFTVVALPNEAPVASLVTPVNDQRFTLGQAISVELSASDSDGNIAHCELLVDQQSVGSDSSAPFRFSGGTLDSLVEGSHTLDAFCVDNEGLASATVTTTIHVDPLPANTASVTLDWIVPSTREDGTALAVNEIDSYEVLFYLAGNPEQAFSINVPAFANGSLVSSYVVNNLAGGNYLFTIATIDTTGNVSAFVDPVALTIP